MPSDVIVDASMAAAVRDAGRMWTKVSWKIAIEIYIQYTYIYTYYISIYIQYTYIYIYIHIINT